ncbi:MAG: PPOX class F420-dependent oxidoreductase [Thermoanaerobaculia bacterium]|nr:PPOX class F420-dependent oxidoreductase [Thermoanaerobaculia bacterium]
MEPAEWRAFLAEGRRTAKLATVRPDGRPHVAPVWFVLDGDELVFTTMLSSVKGKNLSRDPRVMVSVDEESFPYAFVLIQGEATLERLSPERLLPWTTCIAARYVGEQRSEAYGRRNAVEGEALVRVPLDRVNAVSGVAD